MQPACWLTCLAQLRCALISNEQRLVWVDGVALWFGVAYYHTRLHRCQVKSNVWRLPYRFAMFNVTCSISRNLKCPMLLAARLGLTQFSISTALGRSLWWWWGRPAAARTRRHTHVRDCTSYVQQRYRYQQYPAIHLPIYTRCDAGSALHSIIIVI